VEVAGGDAWFFTEGAEEVLDAHHAILRAELDRFGGREVATTGDGLFATFAGPARAIGCACAMRDAVRSLGIEGAGRRQCRDAHLSAARTDEGGELIGLFN
jgi:class 3 adenylate cyclase